MDMDKLLIKMHTYTKIEAYLMTHRDIRHNPELINKFNQQLNESETKQMLVPIINKTDESLPSQFPASFFFRDDDQLKVKMTQHTRYSTPILHSNQTYLEFQDTFVVSDLG
ncbi:hypothetical protein IMAU10382_03069 [Lactiplantibacillus plantarum]|nr:hypothetical protein [Lactiplantibacillus plantarum]